MPSWKERKRLIACAGIGILAGLMPLFLHTLGLLRKGQAPRANTRSTMATAYAKIGSTTTTIYTDRNVTAGQVLHYYVTAINTEGESAPSDVVTVNIPTTADAHSTTLTWTTPA